MDWLDEVNRIDHMLHSAFVSAEERNKVCETIMNLLIQASKDRTRRQLVLESVSKCGNVRRAANQEGWSHETFYAELRPKKVK